MATLESLGDVLGKLGFKIPPREELARPESAPGCERWCLGRGYRRTGSTFVENSASEWRPLAEIMQGITYAYCPCEAGVAAESRHAEAKRALDAELSQRAAARIWDTSEIPPKLRRYSLESYAALPDASAALLAKLRRWQETDRWLLLWGSVGTRKTGLAVSLLVEALEAGRSGLYVVVPDLLERIRLTYRKRAETEADESDVLDSLVGVDLLLLDDLGKVALTDWGKQKLFTLVNRRDTHERRTIVTTNLTLDELEEHVGDAAFDRLRANATDPETGEVFVIEMTGESRR